MPRARQQIPLEWRDRPFSVADATARGLRRGRLSEADLEVPFAGVRSASGPLDQHRLLAAFAQSAHRDLAVSHTSALLVWGAPLPRQIERESRIHVATFNASRARFRRAVPHRLDRERCFTAIRAGIRVTDAASSWVLSAPLLGLDDLVAAGDFLVTGSQPFDGAQPECSLADLAEATRRLGGARGIVRAREALDLVRVGALSRQETFLRLMLVRAGLPEPELNVRVIHRGRHVAMVDVCYSAERIAIEFESLLHLQPAKFRRDIRKQSELAACGWDLHRLTADDVDPRLRSRASQFAVTRIAAFLRARAHFR